MMIVTVRTQVAMITKLRSLTMAKVVVTQSNKTLRKLLEYLKVIPKEKVRTKSKKLYQATKKITKLLKEVLF